MDIGCNRILPLPSVCYFHDGLITLLPNVERIGVILRRAVRIPICRVVAIESWEASDDGHPD